MRAPEFFRDIVRSQKTGNPCGIASICSAHRFVLRAAMEQASADGTPVLIESTVNQVNQFGGYTGMRPEDFRSFVRSVAEEAGFPVERILLGADHAGPYPWRSETAEAAMDRACALAADSVRAGYAKIHLDASMPLGGDPVDPGCGLDPAVAASREARMAAAAERAYAEARREEPSRSAPMYVIGTDVPPPGGMPAGGAQVPVTTVEELERTVGLCEEEFRGQGLASAWERVFAVVVQPGVEFGDQSVHEYDHSRAEALVLAARELPELVLEGHSTDYQTAAALRRLVEDGVAILKVGPALTFAMREALFALERVEKELPVPPPAAERSRLEEALEKAMLADPAHWQSYYRGDEEQKRFARKYGLSDRSRYYWAVPEVEEAVERLLANLKAPIPWPLASQFLPLQCRGIRSGRLRNESEAMVRYAVREVLRAYSSAVRRGPPS